MEDFWSIFARVDCFPNCGCEPMMNGCWICQPMAFVSSIPYFVVAILLIFQNKNRDNMAIAWSLLLSLVALSSMFAHSTYTRIAMAMDYSSIIFLNSFFLFVRLMRIGPMKRISPKILMPGFYIFLFMFMLPLDVWSQFYVCLIFFAIAALDFLYLKGLSVLWERNLIISFGLLALSTLFLMIDKHETFCAMKYVPYGHTIWHLGSALSAYYFGWWYFIEHPKRLQHTSG